MHGDQIVYVIISFYHKNGWLMTKNWRRIAAFFAALYEFSGFAYSPDQPAHHLFNTTILSPYEQQIGMTGNYKVGVNEDWEVGTQGLILLQGQANLYFRHRMFNLGENQTTFTAHLADYSMFRTKGIQGIISINTSMPLTDNMVLTGGVLDLINIGAQDNFFTEELAKTSIYFATAALDLYINPDWSLSTASMLPVYGNIELRSDLADVKSESVYLLKPSDFISPIWLTFTHTSHSFNVEFGAFGSLINAGIGLIPYVNLFWRFFP